MSDLSDAAKPAKTKKKRARSPHYTRRIAMRICERIAGGATIKSALASEPLGPSIPLMWKWLEQHDEFRECFERAQQLQATLHADSILQMAEDVLKNPTKSQAYRVASDILKWQAEIRDPKKYGPKVEHTLKAPPLKPDDLKAEIARLEEELGVTKVVQPLPAPAQPIEVVVPVEIDEKPDYTRLQ